MPSFACLLTRCDGMPSRVGVQDQKVSDLFQSGATLVITDPGVPTPVKVVVEYDTEVQ